MAFYGKEKIGMSHKIIVISKVPRTSKGTPLTEIVKRDVTGAPVLDVSGEGEDIQKLRRFTLKQALF